MPTRSPTAALCLIGAAISALVLAAPASAALVPVDPGPQAAGKPLWGTTQNLPSMNVTSTYEAGPTNAAAIEAYYESGQARQDQREVTKAAKKWIFEWIDRKCGGDAASCNATVVFDVDETLLSNYEYYVSTGFLFYQDSWNDFNEACRNSAIAPTRDLFEALKRHDVTIVLITGRSSSDRSWTAPCLKERGFAGYDRLIMRSQSEESLTVDVFKSQRRAELQRKGHRIVASIGDQVSDMSLGHLKAGFLLPNLMYFIP